MDSTPADSLFVYSDYVCPFCYLGRASLRQYRAETADPPAVKWEPFDLQAHKRGPDGEIDHRVDDGKDDEYFEQALESVRKLQERYDVEMTVDLDRTVDSWNAHLVSLHLRRTDPAGFERFHNAVFDALWQDGEDIGDPEVLADLAESTGVDPAVVDAALGDADLESELRTQLGDAQRIGVRGVPTFVYEQHAASGAIPPEQIQRLVDGA